MGRTALAMRDLAGARHRQLRRRQLVLAQKREVPADATVVVVAGPQTDFLQPEIDALKRYIAKGGKVMFLLDPPEGPAAGRCRSCAD